jgi:hypothetical protein
MPFGRLDKLTAKDIRERVPLAVNRGEAHPLVEDQPLQAILGAGTSEIFAVEACFRECLKLVPRVEHAAFRDT